MERKSLSKELSRNKKGRGNVADSIITLKKSLFHPKGGEKGLMKVLPREKKNRHLGGG